MSIVKKLTQQQLIRPPSFVENGTQYEVYMGSVAYGVSTDMSDIDLYGFCIPPKNVIFPHLNGHIIGYDRNINNFDQYQQHHIQTTDKKEYDITVFNIVKYFRLCADNNPNMIDSLFVPNRCISYMTPVGQLVRENRKLFLHKGAFYKYKGYAYSQLHKCRIKKPEGKRKELIEKYGYDVKFAYHVKRLALQVEQILVEGDLDLERNREELKAIRKGEVKLSDIEVWFTRKELQLEEQYNKSQLPHSPDTEKIKQLLINCLEQYYGKLSNIEYSQPGKLDSLIRDLTFLINQYK